MAAGGFYRSSGAKNSDRLGLSEPIQSISEDSLSDFALSGSEADVEEYGSGLVNTQVNENMYSFERETPVVQDQLPSTSSTPSTALLGNGSSTNTGFYTPSSRQQVPFDSITPVLTRRRDNNHISDLLERQNNLILQLVKEQKTLTISIVEIKEELKETKENVDRFLESQESNECKKDEKMKRRYPSSLTVGYNYGYEAFYCQFLHYLGETVKSA